MGLRCPTCRAPLDRTRACANGHRFAEEGGVLRLLDPPFAAKLDGFLARLEEIRAAEGKRLLDPAAYPLLPFGSAHHEWRLRRYDLALARRLLRGLRPAGRPPRVLDIGAWNGWLSNRLAEDGCAVTAVDYFADPHDGLGARQFYRAEWRAIQLDLLDLAVLEPEYDAVILNRCLQFAPDPIAFARQARRLAAPGGLLLATGIECFADPRAKAAAVAAEVARYADRYAFQLFLRPTKGYLDRADLRGLAAAGLRFRPYPQLWLANLRAALRPARGRHLYGVAGAADL
ncbi:MAG TPA: methyltransferase domain-containing protein [Herpetosiphonaceae bacterium]